MSKAEGFHGTREEVYGGRIGVSVERAQSIAMPLERGSAERGAHNLVWRPETNGVNNVQQTSFGVREASDSTARVIGATVDLGLTPVHGLVRVGATIISEMEKAKKVYVGGVVAMISQWQSPWGRVGAQLMTPVIAGAFALAFAQGVVFGVAKGGYGLLRDKAESFVTHLGGTGETYFQSAAKSYTGHTAH